MINKTKKSELQMNLDELNRAMPEADFSIESAYNMVRLARKNQSVGVSGYMTKKNLLEWIRAYKAGFYASDYSKGFASEK